MEKRSFVNVIICVFFLGMMTFLMGCQPTTATQANPDSKTKEGSMNLAYKIETQTIPPIDTAAPATFETASFALG